MRTWHRTRVVSVGEEIGPGRWQIRVAGTSRFPDVPVGIASCDWRWPASPVNPRALPYWERRKRVAWKWETHAQRCARCRDRAGVLSGEWPCSLGRLFLGAYRQICRLAPWAPWDPANPRGRAPSP